MTRLVFGGLGGLIEISSNETKDGQKSYEENTLNILCLYIYGNVDHNSNMISHTSQPSPLVAQHISQITIVLTWA